jgi:hypothetical protein
MECSEHWPLRVGQISHWCRMKQGIKILERREEIKSGEITFTKMLLTSSGLNKKSTQKGKARIYDAI